MNNHAFTEAYKKLNKAQKEAVDTIDGPVMVVAGPGTGKTQVLALRIANILIKTDIGASGVLCLTFTNSGVYAMRERLRSYIGTAASEVKVSTFHSFAQRLVEKNYELLDFDTAPLLLDEQASVLLFDELLHSNSWEHLRPRGNPAQYFYDLKSLISLLKRENIIPAAFASLIEKDIEDITHDPDNISSRGERKGELKKEALKKIESLERSKEAVQFYSLYESLKKEKGLMDYDDVLSYALDIIKASDDVRSTLQEENQYVLVDEHQDSSGIQNEFLTAIWGDVQLPNIFVVGDDRQLIYGFGGASLSYFEAFKSAFGKAHLVTLIENYRSTQTILDAADSLLTSSMAEGKLSSNTKGKHDIKLYGCEYERDEILLAGMLFKDRIKDGVSPNECVLLVPKNKQVRSAVRILCDLGLPVSDDGNTSFFDLNETQTFKQILKVIISPYDSYSLGELLFSPYGSISPLQAHAFLRSVQTRNLSLQDFISYTSKNDDANTLFSSINPIRVLGARLESWMNSQADVYTLIQTIGKEYFLDASGTHEDLVKNVEMVRTYLHLAVRQIENNPHLKLADFVEYIERLESYKHHIPIATIANKNGIRVMTLHGSKGLEFEVVHIAHMDESSLMKGKKKAFTLPESVENLIAEKDELAAKRELYVAITRAKKFCTLSYSHVSLSGAPLECAHIISELPETHVVRISDEESEKLISGNDIRIYAENHSTKNPVDVRELTDILKEQYMEKNVSVTLLNNFFECPWKWYFSSFLQVPIPKTESLILGSVVHESIEYILKNKINPTEKTIDTAIEQSLDIELVGDKDLRKRMGKSAKKIVVSWAKNYYPHIHPSYITERSVAFHDKSLPHLKMYGKIDLTETFEDSVIVTDFKTGSSKTASAIEKIDEEGRMTSLLRQLAMYSYLLSSQKVTHSRLLFLEEDPKDKNALYNTHITNEQIDLLIRDIKEYDKELSEGTWINRECNFKPYGANTEGCEFCKKAKIYGIEKTL